MSSPITGSDFSVVSAGQSFCQRLTNLLSLSSKMKLWFDWAFDSSGSATNDFKAMFLPPPGVIMAYYASGSEEAVKLAVQNLSGGSASNPFWRICDGTNGTPDMRGRTIVGAGQGDGLTARVLGSTFGAETMTLNTSNLPDITSLMPEMKFSFAVSPDGDANHDAWAPNSGWGFSGDTDAGTTYTPANDTIKVVSTPKSTTANAFQIIQPSVVLYYIIRTNRTA